MEHIMNEFMKDIKKSKTVLTMEEIMDKIGEQFINKTKINNSNNNKANNKTNVQMSLNRNIDFLLSDEFNAKTTEEKKKLMNVCVVTLRRISYESIINDFNIDFLADKKYYDIESEDEYDYSKINNNIYHKCNQKEKCIRLINLFDDDLAEEEPIDHSLFARKTEKKKRGRKRKIPVNNLIPKVIQSVSKKKKISDRVSNSLIRSQVCDDVDSKSKSIIKSPKVAKSVAKDVAKVLNNAKYNKAKRELVLNNANDNKAKRELVLNNANDNKTKRELNKNSLINANDTTNVENCDLIRFMGSHFRSSDLLHTCNNCENGCELDELTLAFQTLINTSDDKLPKDLRLDASDDEDIDEENCELNNSDIDMNCDLPNVEDIYDLTLEENNRLPMAPDIEQEINKFLMNTEFSQPLLQAIDTQIVNNQYYDPIPSTSGYNNCLNQDIHPDLGVFPEDLLSVTPLNINTTQKVTSINSSAAESQPIVTPSANTEPNDVNNAVIDTSVPNPSTQVSDNSLNSSTSTLTEESPKKKNTFGCFHCPQLKFDLKKQFHQHFNETHASSGLPKSYVTFSPNNTPLKPTTAITTTASTLNFNVKSNTTQVFIVNEPQNITITSSLDSIQRKIQFNNE